MTWYAQYFAPVTGRSVVPEDLITISEAVYNFQQIFDLEWALEQELGHSSICAVGPVRTRHESRRERYDGQLQRNMALISRVRPPWKSWRCCASYREDQYEQLKDAVYERRGWTQNGIRQ